MGRKILAVIAGYLAMALAIMIVFSTALWILGPDWAFQPNRYETTTRWNVFDVTFALVAAIFGGWVCATISRGGRAPVALAVLVAVMGAVTMQMHARMPTASAAATRGAEVKWYEAAGNARPPLWMDYTLPLIGIAGVLIGARLRRKPV